MDCKRILSVSSVGDNNKNQIVRVIREYGPISRADISRILRISKPSVSKNVGELIQARILEEIGLANNVVGRKATLLVFNTVKAYVVGVDIGNFMIRVGLGDLSGKLIGLEEVKILDVSPQRDGLEIIKEVERLVHRVCVNADTKLDHVLSVCVGIPGIRDAESGKNYLTPFIKNWTDIDIVGYFKERYPFAVSVINNVNAAAVAEYESYLPVERGYQNVAYINFGIGIGAGLVIDGHLLEGRNSAVGEIGFCCLNGLPPISSDRSVGAFEQMVSAEYWVDQYNQLVPSGQRVGIGSRDVNAIFDAYDNNQAAAVQVVDRLFEQMMMLFINLTAVLNLELIIIGGGVGERMKPYLPRRQQIVSDYVPFAPMIRCAKLGSLSGVYGAISDGVTDVLNDYNNLR